MALYTLFCNSLHITLRIEVLVGFLYGLRFKIEWSSSTFLDVSETRCTHSRFTCVMVNDGRCSEDEIQKREKDQDTGNIGHVDPEDI